VSRPGRPHRRPVALGLEVDVDVEALGLMLGLAEEIDTAISEAVKGPRACD
jgi:hypothetical protein